MDAILPVIVGGPRGLSCANWACQQTDHCWGALTSRSSSRQIMAKAGTWTKPPLSSGHRCAGNLLPPSLIFKAQGAASQCYIHVRGFLGPGLFRLDLFSCCCFPVMKQSRCYSECCFWGKKRYKIMEAIYLFEKIPASWYPWGQTHSRIRGEESYTLAPREFQKWVLSFVSKY